MAILDRVAAEFRQTEESELDAVRALLLHSFRAGEKTPSLQRELLAWKYYAAGHFRPGSRSYVLAENGNLLAHAAICPLALRIDGVVRSGISFCDWAAREEQRGIGLLLLKKLTMLAPFVLAIGGAEITRQILPRVGFKSWASLPVYARVVRPFAQMASRPSRSWKEPLRLLRNTIWSAAPLVSQAGWRTECALPGENLLAAVHAFPGSVHNREFLQFIMRCPAAPVQCLVLSKAERAIGYAVTSLVGRQGRIADLRLNSQDQSDWNRAIALLVKTFRREQMACEVTALAAVPLLESALAANGFRMRERRPLVVLDSEGAMTSGPVPQLGMLVDDASFNFFPEYPYST